MTVTGEDNLLVEIHQRIKGMEKFFLCGFLATNELNIINQQHVGGTVFIAEHSCSTVTDSGNQVIGEHFRRNINGTQSLLLASMSDSLHQMGFAKTDTTINQKRIVETGSMFSHSQRRFIHNAIRLI